MTDNSVILFLLDKLIEAFVNDEGIEYISLNRRGVKNQRSKPIILFWCLFGVYFQLPDGLSSVTAQTFE